MDRGQYGTARYILQIAVEGWLKPVRRADSGTPATQDVSTIGDSKMATKIERFKNGLAAAAPDITFDVSREIDPYFEWDGDGPDPVNRGLDPYDVDVCVRTIAGGEEVKECTSLGGSYFRSDDPTEDPLIHGYLPQMVKEAMEKITTHPVSAETKSQATAAVKFLREWSAREYEQQRTRFARRGTKTR